MVALLRPRSEEHRPALRLVVDNTDRDHPVRGWSWSAPTFDGGPSVVAVVSVAAVVLGLLGLIRFIQAPVGSDASIAALTGTGQGVMATAPTVFDPGDRIVVAEPGDTLWSIARELDPSGDPRPAVSALIEANGGPSLQIGQQIVIPAQLLD